MGDDDDGRRRQLVVNLVPFERDRVLNGGLLLVLLLLELSRCRRRNGRGDLDGRCELGWLDGRGQLGVLDGSDG